MLDDGNIFSGDKPEEKAEKICIRLVIEGKVQKVGYRNWLKAVCVKNRVTGWVRNKADGNVEAVLYGDEKTVRTVILQCYKGPSFASVKRVKEYPDKSFTNIPNDFLIVSA